MKTILLIDNGETLTVITTRFPSVVKFIHRLIGHKVEVF